ncbi:sensor histidine kinase [Nocardioides sp. SYSU DS0651]|uniref:sensor histidine kinase n=1 Tax=Nocardioides sp. SYSU DS0651 TaxID=3415955 RepID=UPI003F4C4630
MAATDLNARRIDLLLCVAVTAVLAVIVSSDQGAAGPVDPLAYLWAVGLGLLMLVRRSHPVLMLVLTVVGFFSYYVAGFPSIGVAVPVSAALFSAAESGHTRAALVAAAVTLGGSTAYRVVDQQNLAYVLGYELATHVTLMAAVVALGHSLRTGRQLRRRRDQVTRLLNRQQVMDADARRREDRLSLARDLHDSIGHSLTLAALHAGLAADQRTGASQRQESISLARTAVSEALSHLRRTVSVLRDGGGAQTTPGVQDLPRLTRAPESAGYDVRVEVDPVSLSPEVDAAAFRVVQEAITNVLRHSTGRTIQVRIAEAPPGTLEVSVADDGRNDAAPALEQGHGLSGMQERVHDLGGDLWVEADSGGWVVRARLPMAVAP